MGGGGGPEKQDVRHSGRGSRCSKAPRAHCAAAPMPAHCRRHPIATTATSHWCAAPTAVPHPTHAPA